LPHRPPHSYPTRRSSDLERPVHLTAILAQPLNVAETPFATVQVNFGHGRSLVAARFEILALTGNDDGSPLPTDVIELIEKKTEQDRKSIRLNSSHEWRSY